MNDVPEELKELLPSSAIPLILTNPMLASLVGTEQFYRDCPEFLHLREKGIAAYNEYMATFRAGNCGGCNDESSILPVIREFVRHCRVLEKHSPESLRKVRDHIDRRRGDTHERYVIHQRVDGRVERFAFG